MAKQRALASKAVKYLISRRTTFRGRWIDDDRPTLVTVNYRTPLDAARLVHSWRRFVGAPVVVVENGSLRDRITIQRATGAKVVGGAVNLHHGLGLDYGLRLVRTGYTVICDSDSIIAAEQFWPQVKNMVDTFGVASIDLGVPTYSPMCLAFRTETWKAHPLSMKEVWPHHDVAGALTAHLGGLRPEALLPLTRWSGGSAETSTARVYGEVFSNTVGLTRRFGGPGAFADCEGSFDAIIAGQTEWQDWADRFISEEASLDDFPS